MDEKCGMALPFNQHDNRISAVRYAIKKQCLFLMQPQVKFHSYLGQVKKQDAFVIKCVNNDI